MRRTQPIDSRFVHHRLGPALVAGLLLVPLSGWAADAGPNPWQDRFLAAPASEVAAAARAVDDPDASSIFLFQESVHTFDADGTEHIRWRRVYKLLTQSAVDNSGIELGWAPWHEDQPVVKVRVVTRDGKAFELDPRTIEVSGAKGADSELYSDGRVMRAPLPGVARGAVVEEEGSMTSRPIAPGMGTSGRFLFGSSIPSQSARLVLDAPRSLPLHTTAPVDPAIRHSRTEVGDRVRLVFDSGPNPAFDFNQDGWPTELAPAPTIRYATGPAWRKIAAHYGSVVDQQIAGADLATWIEEAKAGPRGVSRLELMARLLARLHAQVRYTGVEFSEASIVPRRPAEVLARGYGDCKDQAALLVALLRGAGIPAHVALLRVQGPDTDAALPALEGFDHAIVHVPPPAGRAVKGAPAEPALWIDPTSTYAPLGEVPLSDVNRHALVAAPGTDQPILIPVLAAGKSRVRELRRIVLDDMGGARLVETSDAEGSAGRVSRRDWSAIDRKTLEQRLTAYLKDEYEAKSLVRFDAGSPVDLGKPAHLEVEAKDLGVARVWGDGASVLVRAGQALGRLPLGLRGDREPPPGRKPRKVDFVIQEPYAYEIRYQIVPPHGFAPNPLPAGEVRAIGTGSFRSTFAADGQGVVTATFAFDSGKTRLSPAEVERFRADVKAFANGEAPKVLFHATGAEALAAGKVREALTTFRRLDAEHPGQSFHLRQLAEALLAAGLGQAAREEARRAVAADPTSADNQRMLGWMLEHDLVGRRFMAGCDLPGAQAAYRQSLKLDPDSVWAQSSLAILLERDRHGQRRFPVDQLAEAARLFESLEKGGEKQYLVNALQVQLHLGQFAKIIERTRKSTETNEAALHLAAVTAQQGAAIALKEASARLTSPAQRADALREAGAQLMRLRRYQEAAALYDQAARDGSDGATLALFASRLRRARRHEDFVPNPRKPVDVVKALVAESMLALDQRRPAARAVVEKFAAPELQAELLRPTTESATRIFLKGIAEQSSDVPVICLVDLLLGAEGDVEGDPATGYRVNLLVHLNEGSTMEALVSSSPQGLAVVTPGDRLGPARTVLRLARAGKLEAARTWLDWLIAAQPFGTTDEPLSGSLLRRVWSTAEDRLTAANIELAAAVLLVNAPKKSEAREDALRILTREQASAGDRGSEARRLGLALALSEMLTADGKLAEAEPLLAGIRQRYPRSVRGLGLWLRHLDQRGQHDQAQRLARAELDARPADVELQQEIARADADAGRLADAEKRLGRLAGGDNASSLVFNELAWLRLCRGDSAPETVKLAERGIDLSRRRDWHLLHTLASILAERDEPERARDALIESMNLRRDQGMIDDDHFVLGRMAESYGLPDQARALYGQMTRPTQPPPELQSYALARRRVALLPAPRPAPLSPAAVGAAR